MELLPCRAFKSQHFFLPCAIFFVSLHIKYYSESYRAASMESRQYDLICSVLSISDAETMMRLQTLVRSLKKSSELMEETVGAKKTK